MKTIITLFCFIISGISIFGCNEMNKSSTAENVVARDIFKATEVADDTVRPPIAVPVDCELGNPYPNPVYLDSGVPCVDIGFYVAQRQIVKITIENVIGDVISNLYSHECAAGGYFTRWCLTNDDRRLMEAGLYIVHFSAANGVDQKKIIQIKD